jgi:DNA invertase Pin-like site-specific DNA recombinase
MGTPGAAAIYARISSDAEGTGLGVARQVEDCDRLAERLGWAVAEVYADNDISAYSGKRRPAYERMLADLRDGLRDGVLV